MKAAFYQLLIIASISIASYSCDSEKKEFIQPSPTPEKPTEIAPDSFVARWTAFPSVDHYLLDIALDASFELKPGNEYPIAVTDNFYKVENLKPSTVYYYRVGAKTLSGSTIAYSATQEVSTTSLASPVAYDPTAQKMDQVTAVWSVVKEADGYQLELSSGINFEVILKAYTKTTNLDTLLVIDQLEAKQGYFYRIRSKKGEYYSLPSNIVYFTTTNLVKPVLLGVPEVNYTSITFQWEKKTYADGYEVEVSTDPLFDASAVPVIKLEDIRTTQATVDGLNANTYYYYRVRAKQDSAFSSYSSTLKVKTQGLEVPAILASNSVNTTEFTANWTAVDKAEAYEIDLATDTNFKNTLPTYSGLNLTTLNFLFTNLTPNTTYYLRVRAQGFNAYSDYSDIYTIITDPLLAPANLAISAKTLNSFSLSWNLSDGAESYLLSIATDDAFTAYLSGYEQKEIIGNEWNVEGINPLQNYYISIKSKHGAVLSTEETLISVAASLPPACVLSKRSWDDGWVESYTYDNNQLAFIDGDSAGIARYHWDLFYEGDKLVKADKYKGEALNLLVLREIWLFGYQDTLWTSVHRQDENTNTLEYTTLSYDASGKVIQVKRYADAAATILQSKEGYTYSEGKIVEARDNTNQLIKSWKYAEHYNPVYRFSPATHSILHDPGMSSTLGFVAPTVTSFYQKMVSGSWKKQAYVFEVNSIGMPTKAISGSALPTQTYIFEACEF